MLMENRLVWNKLMSTILTIVTFTLCAIHLLIDFCSEMYLHATFLLFSCLMHWQSCVVTCMKSYLSSEDIVLVADL